MIRLVIISALAALAFASPKALPRLDGRIVGGESVTIQDYKHQVSLLFMNSHICGGSIINAKYVVTAAHCTYETHASDFAIRVGSSIRDQGGEVINIRAIHQNPSFDALTIDYDITILELAKDLTFGSTVGLINLPAHNQIIPPGSDAVCSGWGALEEGGALANQLQAVIVQMVSNGDCNDAYGGGVTDRMSCAGVTGGGKDACQGDSGSPLVISGQLVGIVSWGFGCARPDYPGVYGSVPNLREFISIIVGI